MRSVELAAFANPVTLCFTPAAHCIYATSCYHCTGHCGCPRGSGCGPVYVAFGPSIRAAAIGAKAASVRTWNEPMDGGGFHCSNPSAKDPKLTSVKLWG